MDSIDVHIALTTEAGQEQTNESLDDVAKLGSCIVLYTRCSLP